jgi:hypothetical protein
MPEGERVWERAKAGEEGGGEKREEGGEVYDYDVTMGSSKSS